MLEAAEKIRNSGVHRQSSPPFTSMSTRYTFDRPFRPLGVRAFNAAGRFLERWGWRRTLSVDEILAAAIRRTGLSDFGGDEFQVPLQRLVDDLETSAELPPFGRELMRRALLSSAENRLLLQRLWGSQPQWLTIPPVRPVYVVGLPRTGTTLLYNLLCQDERARPLWTWEALYPAPLKPEWTTAGHATRISRTRWFVRGVDFLAPGLRSIHALVADGPEECGWLLNNTFLNPLFLLHAHVPRYLDWLRQSSDEPFRAAYQHYRKTLQALQAGRTDRHWVLKSPVHQAALEVLLEVLPDARVICTHRDPKQVVPSCCSLVATTRAILSDNVQPQQIGPGVLEHLAFSTARAEQARARFAPRMCDVTYAALTRDPIAAVIEIYRHFQWDCPPEFVSRMQQWMSAHPKDRFGRHRYSPEQFGLTDAMIDEPFAPYLQRIADLPH